MCQMAVGLGADATILDLNPKRLKELMIYLTARTDINVDTAEH